MKTLRVTSNIVLLLHLFAMHISSAVENSGVCGEFINHQAYLKWKERTPEKHRLVPSIIKNKTGISFDIKGENVAAADYYSFLLHVCENAISEKKIGQLLQEMATWIKSDNVYERISARAICLIILPDAKNLIPNSAVTLDEAQRIQVSEKMRNIADSLNVNTRMIEITNYVRKARASAVSWGP